MKTDESMSNVKELIVKVNGFYSKDNGPFSFDDYTLVINGVKVSFDLDIAEYRQVGDKLMGRKGIWAIRSFTIKMDPGEKVDLVSNKILSESEPTET